MMLYKFGNLKNTTSSLKEGYIYMNEFHNFKDDGEKIHSALYFKGDTEHYEYLLFTYIQLFFLMIYQENKNNKIKIEEYNCRSEDTTFFK